MLSVTTLHPSSEPIFPRPPPSPHPSGVTAAVAVEPREAREKRSPRPTAAQSAERAECGGCGLMVEGLIWVTI